MSSIDWMIAIFGVCVLFELHRISDRLARIVVALDKVAIESTFIEENSHLLQRIDQRLELIELHTDTSNDWLRHIVNPPEPKYHEI